MVGGKAKKFHFWNTFEKEFSFSKRRGYTSKRQQSIIELYIGGGRGRHDEKKSKFVSGSKGHMHQPTGDVGPAVCRQFDFPPSNSSVSTRDLHYVYYWHC